MKYSILLLDADETLLDFKRAESHALEETFRCYGLAFNEEIHAMYRTANHELWSAFEEGAITKEDILNRRFRNLFARLGIRDELAGFEEEYQLALGRGGFLLPHAMEVCRRLSGECRLYIVTNGVQATQESRLDLSGLRPFLSGVFVSEAVGYQKPKREYFDYVFARIPDFDRDKTLMVGDSLSSDMRGGAGAGLATCWYNPAHIKNDAQVQIDYEIDDLRKLYKIVKGM